MGTQRKRPRYGGWCVFWSCGRRSSKTTSSGSSSRRPVAVRERGATLFSPTGAAPPPPPNPTMELARAGAPLRPALMQSGRRQAQRGEVGPSARAADAAGWGRSFPPFRSARRSPPPHALEGDGVRAAAHTERRGIGLADAAAERQERREVERGRNLTERVERQAARGLEPAAEAPDRMDAARRTTPGRRMEGAEWALHRRPARPTWRRRPHGCVRRRWRRAAASAGGSWWRRGGSRGLRGGGGAGAGPRRAHGDLRGRGLGGRGVDLGLHEPHGGGR